MNTIPQRVPYLQPTEERVKHFKNLLSQQAAMRSGAFKIGLCWQGKPRPHGYRSMPVETLASLKSFDSVTFISLQNDPIAARLSAAPLPMLDVSAHVKDFNDSAALVAQLNLIITIDTAMAHLAGALGKPTWTLLAHAADWRWLRDRTDSPWYPTMRLFRQTKAKDWNSVMEQVATALSQKLAGDA